MTVGLSSLRRGHSGSSQPQRGARSTIHLTSKHRLSASLTAHRGVPWGGSGGRGAGEEGQYPWQPMERHISAHEEPCNNGAVQQTKWAVSEVVISLSSKSFNYGLATHLSGVLQWVPRVRNGMRLGGREGPTLKILTGSTDPSKELPTVPADGRCSQPELLLEGAWMK